MRISALILTVVAASGATSPQEEIRLRLATPIAFFGKVVDERGIPVPEAQIKLAVVAEKDHYQERRSDESGRFELQGAKGLSLAVWVSKEGYYATDKSRNHFVYGGVRGGSDPTNPTEDAPAIFVLKKMGETHPLVHLPRRTIKVPKDGTPVEVDLSTGESVTPGMGHVRFEVRTANHGLDPNTNPRYDWEARIDITGGGLKERLGEYDFVAPEGGYTRTFESRMGKDTHPWRTGFEKEFFVKLKDGRFARLHLKLTTAGDHFFVFESFLNPTPGGRDLEFDPKKALPAVRRPR